MVREANNMDDGWMEFQFLDDVFAVIGGGYEK